MFLYEANLRPKDNDDTEKISAHKHYKVGQRQRVLDRSHLNVLISIVTIKQKRILQVTLLKQRNTCKQKRYFLL